MSILASQNALWGGRAECPEVSREANCSIHLTQKMQSIFITHVT
jgi:hypothetical protein